LFFIDSKISKLGFRQQQDSNNHSYLLLFVVF
jgi:hypothetical protein